MKTKLLALLITLTFALPTAAKTSGCITCDPAWDPNLPCAGDNCNDGEGNPDGGDTGDTPNVGDSGDTAGGTVSTGGGSDNSDIGLAIMGGAALLILLNSNKSPEEKARELNAFNRGDAARWVPMFHIDQRGQHYTGFQYELRIK